MYVDRAVNNNKHNATMNATEQKNLIAHHAQMGAEAAEGESPVRVLHEGERVFVQRFAAQRFNSTYSFFRESIVAKNRKGRLFLRPLPGKLYGRRGWGTLSTKLPDVQRARLEDQEHGTYAARVLVEEREASNG